MAENAYINIWIRPREHPGALQQGKGYDWGEYLLGNDYISINSQGQNLLVVLNGQEEIFNVRICANPNLEHLITLNCSDKGVSLFFDAFEYGTHEFPECPEDNKLDAYSDFLQTIPE